MRNMKWVDNLRDMGFRPASACKKADLYYLWIRRCKGTNYYEYISVMVDDVIIFSHQPKLAIESIINLLFNYDFKGGAGEPEYLLHGTPLDYPPPMITPTPPIPPEPPPSWILLFFCKESCPKVPKACSLVYIFYSVFPGLRGHWEICRNFVNQILHFFAGMVRR